MRVPARLWRQSFPGLPLAAFSLRPPRAEPAEEASSPVICVRAPFPFTRAPRSAPHLRPITSHRPGPPPNTLTSVTTESGWKPPRSELRRPVTRFCREDEQYLHTIRKPGATYSNDRAIHPLRPVHRATSCWFLPSHLGRGYTSLTIAKCFLVKALLFHISFYFLLGNVLKCGTSYRLWRWGWEVNAQLCPSPPPLQVGLRGSGDLSHLSLRSWTFILGLRWLTRSGRGMAVSV